MEITHLGHASFKIRGRHVALITDPFNPEMTGLKFPKIAADIVTISHQHGDHNFLGRILDTPVIIAGPGEYEAKGVRIVGIATYHDAVKGSQRGKNTIYRIEMDGISLVHCGDLGHKLDDGQIDQLGDVDLLMIPVGGVYTISAKEATEVVHRLEPKIVIPMHYNTSGLSQSAFGELAEVSNFLKEMGKEGIKSQPKLVVSKEKLPAEITVIVLE